MQKTTRYYEFDWLRVIAFFILIFFHVGMAFNTWDWHIKNDEQSALLSYIMIIPSQWRIALLFFISGVGIWFAFAQRSLAAFAAERGKRLLLPLIAGILIVIPPQVYFERLYRGQFEGGYIEFYPLFFQGVYPGGNFSWHHLWFVVYLIVAIILLLPILILVKSGKVKLKLQKCMDYLSHPVRIHALVMPVMLVNMIMAPIFPHGPQSLWGDWTRLTESALIVLMGFLFASHMRFWDVLAENRKINLFLMIVFYCLLYLTLWAPVADWSLELLPWPIYSAIRVFTGWVSIAAILGFARHYLTFTNRFLQYTNEAVYPFYILHQTITVTGVYYLVQMDLNLSVKFLLTVIITVAGTVGLYHFFVRPFKLMRFLFGMKI